MAGAMQAANASAAIPVRLDDWQQYSNAYDRNLSRGGLFLRMSMPPAVGTPLDLDLALPDGTRLAVRVEVVYAVTQADSVRQGSNPGVGVRFRGLTPQQREHLIALAAQARAQLAGRGPTPPPLRTQSRAPRVSPRIDFEVDLTLESGHQFYTGFTKNISAGGLFIQTHATKPLGTELRVKFVLPGLDAPIEADAIVRWVRDIGDSPGIGVQFRKLSATQQAAIDRFIEESDPLFYDDE
jgi:uncharacterized protein (TIGR02266 family)